MLDDKFKLYKRQQLAKHGIDKIEAELHSTDVEEMETKEDSSETNHCAIKIHSLGKRFKSHDINDMIQCSIVAM